MPTTSSETTVVELSGTLEPASSSALTEQIALAVDMEPFEEVLVLRQSGVDTD